MRTLRRVVIITKNTGAGSGLEKVEWKHSHGQRSIGDLPNVIQATAKWTIGIIATIFLSIASSYWCWEAMNCREIDATNGTTVHEDPRS